jgi:hypothetical protein
MMKRYEAWLHHLANILVGGSGVCYAVMRYLLSPEDEYALVNHPWQPTVLHLHVVTAPLLVFVVGLIWRRHVAERWRSQLVSRKTSGLLLAVLLPVMVFSGYIVQVSVEPNTRFISAQSHLWVSLVWVLGYLAHQLAARRRRHETTVNSQEPAMDAGKTPDDPAVSRHTPQARVLDSVLGGPR